MRCTKEWAYLAPKYFKPNPQVLEKYGVKPKEYVFLREVSVGTVNYAGQASGAILGIQDLIPKDKKVILYAPTWRDNEYYKSGVYKFATEMDFNAMKNALSDDYVLIVKFHYLVKDKINWDDYGDFVIECNEMWDKW